MAFEISGAIIAEGLIETVAADAAFELMPLAFESFAPEAFSAFAGDAFAGFGGETLSSLFGSEIIPAAIKEAATPMAQSVLEGGMGAGEGITSAVKGAVETGAALPEASTFAQTAPQLQFSPEELNAINQGTMDAASSGPSPYEPTASTGQSPLVEKAPPTEAELNGINNSQGLTYKGQPQFTPEYARTDMTGYTPGQYANAGNPNLPSTMGNLNSNITAPINTAVPSSSTGLGNMAGMTQPAADSGFMEGFTNFAKNNPLTTAGGIYAIANATGALNHNQQTLNNQPNTFNSPYKFSSSFQGSHPNPQQYQANYSGYPGYKGYADGGITQAAPLGGTSAANTIMDSTMGNNAVFPMSGMGRSYYATPTNLPAGISHNPTPLSTGMAEGGIARYYRGNLATSTGGRGDAYGATQRFLDMYDPASRYQPLEGDKDVGIFRDTNPSTRDKSAYQASGIRNKAIASKANVKTGANYMPPSRQMGQLNLNNPNAKADNDSNSDEVLTGASGGIMGANLGGYAAGGNPRLLRGPGDGMSDNIPATIGGRQPARLADGEFVVPADVVSHLGNGSTEAGAKRLHEMMNKVRVDRTGKKKQAPAVKADKYIPK
jgi:hypothetical protein